MYRRLQIFLVLIILLALLAGLIAVPVLAARRIGPPSSSLGLVQGWTASFKVLWYGRLLDRPADVTGPGQDFTVEPGESTASIAARLAQAGLIRSAGAFRAYLAYSGTDTGLQAGTYRLSPAMSPVEIARRMQNLSATDVLFVVLAGWRTEEIATSLPTSGLEITPAAFVEAVRVPVPGLDILAGAPTNEGYLLPGEYTLPRALTADQLVIHLVRAFALSLTPELRSGFSDQGLTVFQAVTLASIVEREAMVEDEMPTIASVYLNRLALGMKLDADPTIQYALGYNAAQQTWWTNPLSAQDMTLDSPFNTYLYTGLPPSPISNPSIAALRAVAFPAETSYLFFSARCDGSGRHFFAVTLEEQLQNLCP
jgi:UPF0755 protein